MKFLHNVADHLDLAIILFHNYYNFQLCRKQVFPTCFCSFLSLIYFYFSLPYLIYFFFAMFINLVIYIFGKYSFLS